MNKILALALIATLGIFAAAQDARTLPPLTARENPQAVSTESGTESGTEMATRRSSGHLPFCPPKTCLYYAGDFNSADSDANGLFNAYDTGLGLSGQAWVGVKPPKVATVTGVTFNELFTSGFIGTNPTPFLTQIGITVNGAGKIVCNTSGTATMKEYGEGGFGFVQFSYTVKRLKQACRIRAGKKGATYVNLLPTSGNGYGYVVNVEDPKPKNHRGWANDLNDCYFNGEQFPYTTCNSQGVGFSELSIALTGKESK